MNIIRSILSICSHKRTSFPLTPCSRDGQRGPTYIVCLDCGKEFQYNWDAMQVMEAKQA